MTLAVLVTLAVVGAAWWARRRFVIVDVAGQSMEPTLRSGDVLLARRTSPERIMLGQIVVARRSYAGGIGWDVKRVTGMTARGLYLLGDNRDASNDSRTVGLYDRELVLGVVIARLWRIRE